MPGRRSQFYSEWRAIFPPIETDPRTTPELAVVGILRCGAFLPSSGEGEVKGSALRVVRRCPYASPVAIHDRVTDRKSHPHAAWLGCVEWIEKTPEDLRGYARA
jgi:hypothetical protein